MYALVKNQTTVFALYLFLTLFIYEGLSFVPLKTVRRKCSLRESGMDLLNIEKEVAASAKVKMDKDRVVQALDSSKKKDPKTQALLASPWQISAAAAISAFVGTFFVFHSTFFSTIALIGVFISAAQDPLDDEGFFGPVSRILGRATIQTVESSKPRLKRMARAAILDEEDVNFYKSDMGKKQIQDPKLARYIQQLEEENASLSLWKERRLMVEEYLPYYSMNDLHLKAKQHNIDINCTKAQLMMRLVEINAIKLY